MTTPIFRQALIMSVLHIADSLLMLLTFVLFDVAVDHSKISALLVFEYSADIVHILAHIFGSYWWLFVVVISIVGYFCMAILRWDKKGVKEAKYKEGMYWMKFTALLFILINSFWVLMSYLSQFSQLDFLIKVESLSIAAALIALILYIMSVITKIGR